MEHAQIDLDRRDQLRARERAGQALQRGLEEDRPLPPAPREGRHPHPAEAGVSRGWRGGAVGRHREGLRDQPGPVRRGDARGARGARPEEDKEHRHRGVRRPRGHRPAVLRPPLLPAARSGWDNIPNGRGASPPQQRRMASIEDDAGEQSGAPHHPGNSHGAGPARPGSDRTDDNAGRPQPGHRSPAAVS